MSSLIFCVGMTVDAGAQTSVANVAGTWNGTIIEARSECTFPVNNGNRGTYGQLDVGVGQGNINMQFSGITGLMCDYTGTYAESGAERQAAGTFQCSDGRRGNWLSTAFLVTETALSIGLSAQLTGGERCIIAGVIGASRLAATTPPPQPSIDYTGAWFNPAESGWGLSVIKGGSGVLGVILFHYGANRSPTWFILQNAAWQSPTVFSGTLYRFNGPPYLGDFDATTVSSTAVGNATLTFTSPTAASITYSVDGLTRVRTLAKIAF